MQGADSESGSDHEEDDDDVAHCGRGGAFKETILFLRNYQALA